MSTQRLGDEPFASDEDLFFHKLFAEDELSQRKASKTTSMFTPPFKHHVPPPPSFSQLFSQSTQNKMYSSQSKTVAKVQPHTTTHNPTASWQTFSGHSTSVTKESEVLMGFDEIDDHDLDNTCFSQHPSYHHEGTGLEYEERDLDHNYRPVTNVSSFQTPSQMVLNVPSRGRNRGNQQLRPVAEIPEQFRSIFSSFPYFNFVQSKVLDDVLYTDKPVVVCSPTGSGKTVVFELAIIRLLMNFPDRAENFKIVYMAPMKALCSERYEDWSKKFGPVGMTCKELTGDSEMDDYLELQAANIVMTTPEKWDSMTRKWKDNRSLVQAVRLFLIDEVHLLNDESRGPTMEAVISRMKTVKTAESRASNQREIFGANMRFLAISATIPNADDIGKWLETEEYPAATYSMDDSYRPVKLRKVVIGYPCNENTSNFRFDLSLNYKLSSIIQTYSENKPTLVFCSTRKGTQQAGSTLTKDARFVMNSEHRQRLQRCANSLHDSKLRELVMCGVAYHHAGLDSSDRKSIEAMFTKGELPVLFATSTLAMGVNLPAHLVIIKSTMQYVKGVFEEYAESQILQMTGRAGRPQFDDSATAVIMTKYSNKMKYEAIIGGTQNIESSLHKNLIEHLNAEIVLNTITDVSIALEWLKSTFLYIRILKNPTYYGIPEGLDMDILETKLQEMCVESLNTLRDHGLINMDEGFDLKPTDTGKLMARYCLAFESIKLFLGLQGNEDLNDLVNVVCQCKEFIDLKLRNNEKKVLNTLNKDKNRVTIRFPINGKIKTTEQKISCLLQATLGCLPINEFSLNQDVTKIFRSGQRVSKCLYEFCMLQNNYNLLMNALQLSKCFRSRIWENSKYVSKQLEKVGLSMSTMLVNAGLTTFQKIEETNPREIELIVNRHPPFGNQVKEAVASLPKYEVDIEQKSNYGVSKAELVISVTMVNYIKRQDSGKSTGFHYCILLVADADNQIVHKQRLSDAVFFAIGTWSKKIEVKRAYSSSELTINVISQDLVGLDLQKTFTPYYNGPHIDYYKRPTSLRRKNIPVKVSPEETERRKRPEKVEKRQPCNHRCINKHLCAHECCKIGVIAKKIEPKWSDINQNTKTPRNENTSRSRESKLNTFVDQLHARNQLIPATPGRKRLLGHSTGTDFEFSRSGTGRSILSQYEYKRKAKISRVNVQHTGTEEDIADFEDDDWQEMDFYEDTMKTGNPDKIDLTGEIWDQDFDNEDDDWYLEFGFLDDKPKQSKRDESTEPPLPDTNVHFYHQKKYQNSTISNQGQLKPNTTGSYPGNQTQVRPTTTDESMTNAKCNSFLRPDFTQCKPSSLLSDNKNKQTLANQSSTTTKLPPKASLYKSNLWESSISCNNNPGPSKNIRLSNSPKCKSNFSWSTNPGSPNESLTKPLPCKISLHGDFLTTADVAEARRKRQNEMSYLGRSVHMNDFSSNGLGKNQPSIFYSGTQKEGYGQEQEGAVQTRLQESLPRSQYFNSNAYFGGNKINTHITSKPSNTLSTDQDMISPQTQRLYDGEQRMHQSSPEWEMGPEYGTLPSSDTQKLMTEAQKLARVEDTAKTKSFHKSVHVSVLQERSNNAKCDREWGISRGEAANTNTCGKQVTNSVGSISFNSSQCYLNAFSGVSDDEEENQDAFKNIFTDVF